jgi:hypothetical protein
MPRNIDGGNHRLKFERLNTQIYRTCCSCSFGVVFCGSETVTFPVVCMMAPMFGGATCVSTMNSRSGFFQKIEKSRISAHGSDAPGTTNVPLPLPDLSGFRPAFRSAAGFVRSIQWSLASVRVMTYREPMTSGPYPVPGQNSSRIRESRKNDALGWH